MSADAIWSLISNAALLLALGALYDAVLQQSDRLLPLKNLLAGVVIGVIGITIMFHPWPLVPGLFFDTRSILLSVAALFFGVVPAVVAAFMTILFRVFQGGIGLAPGVATISMSILIGLGWRYYRPQWQKTFGFLELYLFGCIVHIVMLMCMLLLPWPMASRTLANITVPVLLIYPLGTVLLGMLLEHQLTHREAESLVRASESRFRKMIEQSGDMIFLVNSSGRISYASESILRILGYPVEVVLGRSPTENIHPVDIPLWLDVFSSLRASAEASRSVRFRVRHYNGRWLWLDVTVTNLLNDSTVNAFVVNARDLSERKLIEMELEQQTTEISSLYETARKVHASLSLEAVSRSIVGSVLEALNPDRVFLFLCQDDALILQARAPEQGVLIPSSDQRGEDCLCRLAVAGGKPAYSLDIQGESCCARPECTNAGIVSAAAIPLCCGSRIVGVCCVVSNGERDFQQQAQFLDALADQLATGVQNALLYEDMQRRVAVFERQAGDRSNQLEAVTLGPEELDSPISQDI